MATLKQNRPSLLPLLAIVVSLALAQTASAGDTAESADQQPSAKPLCAFSCILAGSETQFVYELTHVDAARVRVDWTLLVDRQPVGRGIVVPDVVNAKGARTIAISLTIPSVRPGVVLSATLRLALTLGAKNLTVERPLYIFHPDPFYGMKSLPVKADIQLLDITGETSKVFDESSISFRRLPSVSSIDDLTAGTLIVGEGTDFDEQHRLADILIEASGRGVCVLVLAPTAKPAVIVSADILNSGRLRRVEFRNQDVLHDFDKRFDTSDWSNSLNSKSTLKLQAIRNEPVIGIAETANGWTWLELNVVGPKSAVNQTNVIVCGFGAIRNWRTTPVPRYLFAKVLQKFVEFKSSSSKERD
jgi:hypothetical protein